MIAAAYAVACAILVPLDLGPSWDEIVYSSQFGRDQVPMGWGGHRAWGSALLVAPVAVLTKSVVALRVYLVLLAGVAMYAAFRPWVSVFTRGTWTRYTAPCAATVFGTTWFAVYYGSKAYPNVWLAFALLAGTGYFVRTVQRPPSVAPLVGAFVAFAVAAVFRPTDTVAAAAPLLLTLLIPRWRTPKAAGATVGGVALGTGPWIVEAFLRFDGPIERLRGSAESANAGVRLRVLDQIFAADGPYLLCNPALCRGVTIGIAAWWLGQILVAIVGVLLARRQPVFMPLLLVVVCAALFAGPYFTAVGGSHPRFLIPAYALLSLAAAFAVLSLLARINTRLPWLAAVIVAVGVLFQATAQGQTLRRVVTIQVRTSDEVRMRAAALMEQGGLTAPCLLYGEYTVGLSYYPGCDRVQTDAPPTPRNKAIERALADGHRVALVFGGDVKMPEPYASWPRLALPGRQAGYAYLSPRSTPPGGRRSPP